MNHGILEYLMAGCLFFAISCRSHDDDDDDDEQADDYDVDCTFVNPDDETACISHLCEMQALYRSCEGSASYCYGMEACDESFSECLYELH